MLLNLSELIGKHSLKIKGAYHIGAHHGQEFESYKTWCINNIIFFEAYGPNYLKLREFIDSQDTENMNIHMENIALGHRDGEHPLYVETENKSMSCSLLKPKVHLDLYPKITFDEEVNVKQTFLDKFVIEKNVDTSKFNFINIDVQGYELEVFKGAAHTLNDIDYIYTEVNNDELYENCVQMSELDEFLGDLWGFERIETKLVGNQKWGDALYVKRQ